MSKTQFSSYTKSKLADVLRVLKDYRSSLKQIGNRATLSDSREMKDKNFRIEYSEPVDIDFLKNFSEKSIQKYFPEANQNATRIYTVNNALVGGIRIFYGDDMIDLSFQNLAYAFK